MLSCLVAAACGNRAPASAPSPDSPSLTPSAPVPSANEPSLPPRPNATEPSAPSEKDRVPHERVEPTPEPSARPSATPAEREPRNIVRERPPAPLPPQPAPFTPTMPAPEPL